MTLLGHEVGLRPALRLIGLKLKVMREKRIERTITDLFVNCDID